MAGGGDITLKMLGAVGLATALQQAADETWRLFGLRLQQERDFRAAQLDTWADDGGLAPQQADHFTRAVLCKIAAGFGLTYEQLTADFVTAPNYAADLARLELLWRRNDWQAHMAGGLGNERRSP